MNYREILTEVFDAVEAGSCLGQVSSYIPELAGCQSQTFWGLFNYHQPC
jgi:glutaminase